MNSKLPQIILGTLILLLILSWSNVLGYNGKLDKEYNNYIKQAEENESKEIYIDAVRDYNNAYNMRPDYDLALHIADLYLKLDKKTEYANTLNKALEIDPKKEEVYLKLINYYETLGNLNFVYSTVKKGHEAIPESEKLAARLKEMQGKYTTTSQSIESISDWYFAPGSSLGYQKAIKDEKPVIIDSSFGIVLNGEEYQEAGLFLNDVAPVKKDNQWYYIDSNGYKKRVPERKADYLGPYTSNYAPAKIDGKYGYLDAKMKEYSFDYDYAGCFYNNLAPVKKDGKWAVINNSFQEVVPFEFDEILMDDNDICSVGAVFFAKKDNKYYLYNSAGTLISDGFDDAKLFVSNQPAAVKIGSKWGYVSVTGEIVIEPQYSDANSFNKDLAPVESKNKKGKWGCIDINNEIVIEPEFDYMGSFMNNGYAEIENEDTGKSQKYITIKSYE